MSMRKISKKILLLLLILITISLSACADNKVDNYFKVTLSNETITNITARAFGLGNLSASQGILIEPKRGLDLSVDGKIVFKKFKLSYIDKHGTECFMSNMDKFEIKLDNKGTNKHIVTDESAGKQLGGFLVDSLSSIKYNDGKKVFPNLDGADKSIKDLSIVDYDAYFEGTIKKN